MQAIRRHLGLGEGEAREQTRGRHSSGGRRGPRPGGLSVFRSIAGGFSVGTGSHTRSIRVRSRLPSNGALGVDEGNSIFERGIGQRAVELFWFALLTKIIHTYTHINNNGNRHVHISESESTLRYLSV